jgi:protein deglycase
MANVLIPVADGSEEQEIVSLVGLLRRGGLNVTVASVMSGRKRVNAANKTFFEADQLLSECLEQQWDMIVVPGNLVGAGNLGRCDSLLILLQAQSDEDRWLAAICAAPVMVLGPQGLVDGARATCFPPLRTELEDECGAIWKDEAVVVDGNLITSQGPDTARAFALKLIEVLAGAKASLKVAEEQIEG